MLTVLAIGMVANSLLTAYSATDPLRTSSNIPPKLELVSQISTSDKSLAVLVPENERIAEAILPKDQRLSSSFRYGGAPSIVYYYGGKVDYYYNTANYSDLLINSQGLLLS